MSHSQGQQIDQFYAHQPKPVENTVLALLQNRFDYLECQGGCGTMVEVMKLNPELVAQWKFDFMRLRPSILGVAHGLCPTCQGMRKQFDTIFKGSA